MCLRARVFDESTQQEHKINFEGFQTKIVLF